MILPPSSRYKPAFLHFRILSRFLLRRILDPVLCQKDTGPATYLVTQKSSAKKASAIILNNFRKKMSEILGFWERFETLKIIVYGVMFSVHSFSILLRVGSCLS